MLPEDDGLGAAVGKNPDDSKLLPWSSKHTEWLVDTEERLQISDGTAVQIWEFRHEDDEEVLSAWAKHFRNHYCSDREIDYWRKGYNYSRAEYLNAIKFPDPKAPPGPSIRAGDFGEVLVADFLEYKLNYWVPRTRYNNKTIRNESTKGADIIGFHIIKEGGASAEDKLAIFESKTRFSSKKNKPQLQTTIDGSAKDITRKAESLNAIKQRLFESRQRTDADKIERFQNYTDQPYEELYGAVALFENSCFDSKVESSTDSSSHPRAEKLFLMIVNGEDMMSLVHQLYQRAADEA